jgi:Tfp pilus assembly PilM family ATPase
VTRVIGLDIGEDTTRVVEARLRKGAFEIRRAAAFPTDELATSLREQGLKGCRAIVGVTGRDMILRTTQVPSVPTWQLRDLMAYEIEEVSEQSGDSLSADFNLLTGARRHGDDEMALLALVRDSLIEERTGQLQAAGVAIAAFTPNAIALHNAVVATDGGEGVVLVASLGGRTTDVAILQDGELLFARNLGGGGELFTEAIADALRLDEQGAELAKRKLALFPPPGQAPANAQQAAVVRALDGPLRQVAGMLQSSLVLCRNQLQAPDLKLTRVLLCGAGASIPGLDLALTRSLGVPVARFDPTDGYLTEGAEIAEGRGSDFAIAAGLALMAVLKDSYRVEILSAQVARRRRFVAHTLWLWLAGALVAGHLVLAAVTGKADYDAASEDRARASREVEARKADLRAYERAADEVKEVSARLLALEDLTAPGSGVITVLDRLDGVLPPELWLRSVRTQRAVEPEFEHGAEKWPFVTVEGEGKEQSRGLTDAVTELTTRLRADPGIARVVPRFTTNSKGKFSFSLSIDTSLFPPAEGAAGSAATSGSSPGAGTVGQVDTTAGSPSAGGDGGASAPEGR